MKAEQHKSPNSKAWKRLKRNKPALFGLAFIALASLISVLGYLVVTDQTPNANDQMVEVKLKEPGFSVEVLKVHKNRAFASVHIFEKAFYGKTSHYRSFPINSYQFLGDSIFVETYSDEGEKGRNLSFHLADVVHPIKSRKTDGNSHDLEIIEGDGVALVKTDNASLQKEIEDKLITKRSFLLGSDFLGRSIFSRLMLGTRISLLVGLIAVCISLTIGILLGALAGYYGGRVDDAIMFLINSIWSIPTLLLVFAIILALGRSVSIVFLAVGLTMWVDVARIVRGQVLAVKEMQYIEAAFAFGYNTWRIISRHVLPNILGPVMVVAAANFAMAILLEAGLSFLGFGIQPPQPSWGTMLNENYGYAISGKPFLAFAPAFAIMLMVLAFNLVGNGLRDALDVQTQTK